MPNNQPIREIPSTFIIGAIVLVVLAIIIIGYRALQPPPEKSQEEQKQLVQHLLENRAKAGGRPLGQAATGSSH